MRAPARILHLILVVGIFSFHPTAFGWLSGVEIPGPLKTRMLWSADELENEHAQLLREAIDRAKIPSDFYTRSGSVIAFTDRASVASDGLPSQRPVAFGSATGTISRSYNITGFAGLPDHSFALWDWASGNETCPAGTVGLFIRPGITADQACHEFKSHLGTLNSTHFLPQAQF